MPVNIEVMRRALLAVLSAADLEMSCEEQKMEEHVNE